MMRSVYKLLFLSFCLLVGSDQTFAEAFKTGLEFRTDYEINDGKDPGLTTAGIPADANDEKSAKKFNVSWARLVLTGDINEKASYKIKLNTKGGSLTSSDYGTSPAVTDAYATYKLTDKINLDFGKFFLLTGGWEGYHNPQDIYVYTLAFSRLPYFETGARVMVNYEDQTIILSASNAGKELNQKTPMFGVLWLGNLMNNMIKTNFSFFYKPLTKQSGSPSGVTNIDSRTEKFLALGLRINLMDSKLAVELGYNKNLHEKNTSNADDKEQSLYTQISYRHEEFKPFVKIESSTQDQAGSNYLDRMVYSLGTEYFPLESSNFRFHAVYLKSQDKFKTSVPATATTGARSNGTKVESSQFLLGLAFEV